jgi:hypothetical protein
MLHHYGDKIKKNNIHINVASFTNKQKELQFIEINRIYFL